MGLSLLSVPGLILTALHTTALINFTNSRDELEYEAAH